ncbi:NADP-dependent oxidoreductase [Sphingobacterium sp. ML3W]|uniref:NADP-dependent oxidoreductase n=1 Tax=Sphingobacterium sp. ML3W TaxID=1538644 RepID=UPI00249B2284|nr:NADP-dependent oxidoreductase [Sphingobacterium sp. ML3W]WFA81365.1 NADP-dependent oxidoreductase [Sphingobacterium sp. ML3W]
MKVIQFNNYGDSSVLHLNEISLPKLGAKDVMIKISAVSVNPLDIKLRNGEMKNFMPISFPFIPGLDVAGTVEKVGEKVTKFKKGDKVFATTFGNTYSEYVSLEESIISRMPKNLDFVESAAAAIPLTTAYTILLQEGNLKAGQTILVHGAAGGVGHVLVQMAKNLGAKVIATATGEGLEFVKSMGVSEVLDYKFDHRLQNIDSLDMVIDLVGGETHFQSYNKLKPRGILLSTVMPGSEELANKFGITTKFVNAVPDSKKLDFGVKYIENGNIKIKVFRKFSLTDAAVAQDFVGQERILGKVVLEIIEP